MSDSNTDFTGQCGECTKGYHVAVAPGAMQPNQSATINGKTPQNCVVGNNGAVVYGIDFQKIAGIYGFQVRVDAQGPSGAFSGYFHLAFQDLSGDVYYLNIYSSTREWHTVSFNSDSAAITKIFWSDYSFTVTGNELSSEKADYQILSPAPDTENA